MLLLLLNSLPRSLVRSIRAIPRPGPEGVPARVRRVALTDTSVEEDLVPLVGVTESRPNQGSVPQPEHVLRRDGRISFNLGSPLSWFTVVTDQAGHLTAW